MEEILKNRVAGLKAGELLVKLNAWQNVLETLKTSIEFGRDYIKDSRYAGFLESRRNKKLDSSNSLCSSQFEARGSASNTRVYSC